MISGEAAFHTIGTTVLADLLDRLRNTAAGPPDRACLVPGAIAWDQCQCGLLAISLVRTYLTADFPREESAALTGTGGCEAPFMVGDMIIQIIRCAPNPQGATLSAPCPELDASALTVTVDAHHVLNGTACTLAGMVEADQIIDYQMRPQTIVGPQGGCVGSETRALVCIPRV